MPVTKDQFRTDLAALLTSVGGLITAVQTWVAAHGADDFTAEDQAVLDAAGTVQTEMNNLNPPQPIPAPPPPPTPGP